MRSLSFFYQLAMLSVFSFIFTACQGQPSGGQAAAANAEANTPRGTYEQLDNAAFNAKIGTENTILLDLRTPGETSRGIIPGALIIDYNGSDFRTKIEALDRDKTYLVYCQSGVRSGKTCREMQSMGFTSLYELRTGYAKWQP